MEAGLAVVAAVGGLGVERVNDSRIVANLTDEALLAAEHTGEHMLFGQTDRLFEIDEECAGLDLKEDVGEIN